MTFKIHTYKYTRVRIHRNEMRFFIFPSLRYETHKKYFYHQLTADDCFGWMFNNCRSSFALFLLSFSYGCQLCNVERCDEKVKESNIESHTHTYTQIISWICLFFKNIFLFSPHENFTIKSNFNTMAMIQYKKQPICVFLLMVLLVIAIFFIHMVKNRRRIIIRIQLTSLIRFLSRIVIFTILIETIVWADVFVLQLSGFISRLWTIPRSTE